MSKRQFVENSEGVHLVSKAEYTLCGVVIEGDLPIGLEPCVDSEHKVVTCEGCIEILELCRGVRFKRRVQADGT
jgi:hypothetical protein